MLNSLKKLAAGMLIFFLAVSPAIAADITNAGIIDEEYYAASPFYMSGNCLYFDAANSIGFCGDTVGELDLEFSGVEDFTFSANLFAALSGSVITSDDLDSTTAATLLLGKSTATKVEIADSGIETNIQGTLKVDSTISLQNSETIGNATDGKIKFAGIGGSNNEDLTFDFETTANSIDLTSSTGATKVDFGTLDISASIGSFTQVVATTATNPLVDLNPSGTGGGDVINLTPSAALTAATVEWNGLAIDGAALDPGDIDNDIRGICIDFSGVDTTNNPHIDGLCSNVPTNYHALHIQNGDVRHDYTTPADAGAEWTAHRLVMDGTNLNAASTAYLYDISLTNGAPAGDVYALGIHEDIGVISHSPTTYSTPSQTEYAGRKTGGGVTWADGIDTNEIFVQNSDAVYIGSAAQFSRIQVVLSSDATRDVDATFWYNTAADTWTEFFPSDSTNGFQTSGILSITLGDISALWTNDGDPGAADSSAGYWIKIVRTVTADPGTPTPTTMKTGVATGYGWDKTGAVDVLSMEADTITEGGNVVYNSSETPGGELGGTWASPTIDDSVTVTGWTMGASAATTAAGDDNDTSLATTAWCETTQNYLKTSELAAAETDPLSATKALDNLASVAISESLVSDAADTDSLGSATFEWLNAYIGDAGKLYFGLGQDASIEHSAANELTITATSGATIEGVKIDGGVVTGASSITSTGFTGALTGNASTATILETTRAIYGNNFDGSAALDQIIASTYGGTGNGFTKFSGATAAEKTYTLPDANATLLYSGGALGTPSGGTLTNATGLPISSGVSGLGTGVATFLATPSSANFASAVTGETGTGALVFGTSPSFTTPNIGSATGSLDAGGETLEIPNGTDLPATCSIGQLFQDTNDNSCADSNDGDGALCLCKSSNVWSLVADI